MAFWLHLLTSPMIVHSVFTALDVFEGRLPMLSIVLILVMHGVLSVVSLVIDRRAFMVSSLAYVLYALSELFSSGLSEGRGMAMGGLLIGGMLLVLTVYWVPARRRLLAVMPEWVWARVPG